MEITRTEVVEDTVHKYAHALIDGGVEEENPDKLDGVLRAFEGRMSELYPPSGMTFATYITLELLMERASDYEVETWFRSTKTVIDHDYIKCVDNATILLRKFTHPGEDDDPDDEHYNYDFVALRLVELTTLAYDPTSRKYAKERGGPRPRPSSDPHSMDIPRTSRLGAKQAVVAVKCDPSQSLLYAVASALHDSTHPWRVAQYRKRIAAMTTTGMTAPYGLTDVLALSRMNPELPPIAVHGLSLIHI